MEVDRCVKLILAGLTLNAEVPGVWPKAVNGKRARRNRISRTLSLIDKPSIRVSLCEMWRKRLLVILAGLLLIYGVATAALYAAMRQTPDTFGAIMARVPMISMMILPFRPLWMSARAGHLQVGAAAPDFNLPLIDRSRTVQLSTEYRERPVVLVFGSYT